MISPEIPICLNYHLVRSAEEIEIIHVLRAQIDLQCGEHLCWRQTDFLGLYSINVSVNRRRSCVEQRAHAGEMWIFVGSGDQIVCRANNCF